MSSNKSIRDRMIEKYGKICMMEEAGIRKIPIEERRRLKGYKKIDDTITYHHLRPKSKGGQATEENGALLKWYNHQWLEQQPIATREYINNQLKKFKAKINGMIMLSTQKGFEVVEQTSMDLDGFNSEFYIIPVYDNLPEKEEGEEK